MTIKLESNLMRVEEYLKWEKKQPNRYEYFKGQIIAWKGLGPIHEMIFYNLARFFTIKMLFNGGLLYLANKKLKISLLDIYFYPDLMISWDDRDDQTNQLIEYPSLIIEITSLMSDHYDRTTKLEYYRQIETLQDYVIIDGNSKNVDHYQRGNQKRWFVKWYSLENDENNANPVINLISANLRLPLTSIYQNIIFP